MSATAFRLSLVIRSALGRVDFLALFPLIALTALWFNLADIVAVTAFVLPLLLALNAIGKPRPGPSDHVLTENDIARGMIAGQDGMVAMLDRISRSGSGDTACIMLQIDDWDGLVDRWGGQAAEDLALRCLERLTTSLRSGDLVARLGDARFGVVLKQIPKAQLGIRDGIVGRLRHALQEPIAIDGTTARLTVSVGHSNLLTSGVDPAGATFYATEAALAEAHRSGPNAVRAYAPGLVQQRNEQNALSSEVEDALAAGDIRPWFQPQIDLVTGAISGFEALARWHHPDRGVLPPGLFLDAVEDAGRMDQLGQSMLSGALTALQAWDDAGMTVPSVAVNFSAGELRDPDLVDRIVWELDRFNLQPNRLTVEILETVAAETEDDTVLRTLTALGAQGLNLDLDDFGIGQASLAAVRRFGVSRIKIDRSFILGVEDDAEQRAMVSAILAMAGHLNVTTLAEGVETEEARRILRELGCNHLQGYLVARPMPFDQTIAWAKNYAETTGAPHILGQHVG
ncbi:MAG: bifunctional diguanylate cyclase/phosphodiesterase [Pseudomonadota bacterium]